MVPTYSDYISSYVSRTTLRGVPTPGEHHFVATYLAPKLYAINNTVPDFVNPDGTKEILGDIVYYRDGRHHYGIEVKFEHVRLTKREFNKWIVQDDPAYWPNLFIGVGGTGLVMTTWDDFRSAYNRAVGTKRGGWVPTLIADGYGPLKAVTELERYMREETRFPFLANGTAERWQAEEARFAEALRQYLPARLP